MCDRCRTGNDQLCPPGFVPTHDGTDLAPADLEIIIPTDQIDEARMLTSDVRNLG